MLIASKNLCGGLKALPYKIPQCMHNHSLLKVVKVISKNYDSKTLASGHIVENKEICPETEALRFYLLNHICAHLTKNPDYSELPNAKEFFYMYHHNMLLMVRRMFSYLMLICTREARHAYQHSVPEGWEGARDWHTKNMLNLDQKKTVANLFNNPPQIMLGEYAFWLVDVFLKGKFDSSFGGKAWAKIAIVLRDFILGEITAEMMLDTAFTLAHNTGLIFNKGMFFTHYSKKDLLTILDVQRAGQIPNLLYGWFEKSRQPCKVIGIDGVRDLYLACTAIAPDLFKQEVDWHAVQQAGAVQSYKVAAESMPKDFKAVDTMLEKAKLFQMKAMLEALSNQTDALSNKIESTVGSTVKEEATPPIVQSYTIAANTKIFATERD